MQSNVVSMSAGRITQLRNKILGKYDKFSDESVAGQLVGLMYHMHVSEVGSKELVDSCRPHVRIHEYFNVTRRIFHLPSQEPDGGFRVEVTCHDNKVAEWFTPSVSINETQERLLPIDGKRPDVPWAEIAAGLHWYAELDMDSTYWRLLEAELLRIPVDDFNRRDSVKVRSVEIESRLNPSYSSQSHLFNTGSCGLWTIKPSDEPAIVEIKKLVHARELAAAQSRQLGRGSWAQESLAVDEATRPFRYCEVSISAGELEGKNGYFTRYSRDGRDICITFAKRSYEVTRYVDHDFLPRIPWKKIGAGKEFCFKTFLADHFLTRITDGSDSALYYDVSSLNPLMFHDCQEELSAQYGF